MVVATAKYRLTALFALLLVLLLFIAPLVSASLASASRYTATSLISSSEHQMMVGMEMPMISASTSSPSTTSKHSDPGVLCGYCDFLIHVPFFLWDALVILWLLGKIVGQPPLTPYRGIVHSVCYSAYRSRGPPRL